MSKDPCDGCGTPVRISGGISDLWTFSSDTEGAGGMTLEFDSDGSEHFLCFDCIDRLPDDPTAADVAALADGQDDRQ
ncbi:DUF7561 family protein [Haloarchaeobius sp. DFWS5]|uniref:DUF7561 family protein n=1 Tax=Haloarchaeobius sp. DFWS5 TaxID=3446114 RepID=UPI003EBB368A